MSDTHDMTEHNAATTAVMPDIVPEKSTSHPAPSKPAHRDISHLVKKPTSSFDNFVAKVRDVSPAWLVNNGSRFCLAFKFSADGFSIASALRKKSPSPWRLRASLVTAGGEILGMIFPEKDISDEQRAGYRKMSPVQFFVTKTREALNPKDYITETTGLALIINGIFMSMAGRAQSTATKKSWEIVQGMMTSVAGVIMTYWPDRERAWQLAHSTFMIRSVPAALQADNAYRKGFPDAKPPAAPGDWQQWAKWVLNQIANVLGTFYGGVKKMPDGQIVHIGMKGNDVTAPRQSRRLANQPVALPAKIETPASDMSETHKELFVPETSISKPAEHSKVSAVDIEAAAQVGAA